MGSTDPTGFLYPFIGAEERDAPSLLAELVRSARAKAAESAALQQATLAACAGQSVHRIQESQAMLGYQLWASTQQVMQKTVDRCAHPDVHSGPSSGPNPHGGTE